MKHKHRSLVLGFCLCLTLLLGAALPARADTGPKPSVTITLEDLPAGRAYATLLSKSDSSGPYSAYYDYGDRFASLNVERGIWDALKAYSDGDGFFFLGFVQDVTESKTVSWSYYPPETFKLLIYLADSNTFLISGTESRYAFDSLFAADCSGGTIALNRTLVSGNRIAGIALRVVCTILIELGIAWLFRLRGRREILVIVLTNLVTQILMNLVLMTGPSGGRLLHSLSWLLNFLLCELCVFIVEAVIYSKKLRNETRTPGKLVLYAFLANLASMALGICFMNLFPSLF